MWEMKEMYVVISLNFKYDSQTTLNRYFKSSNLLKTILFNSIKIKISKIVLSNISIDSMKISKDLRFKYNSVIEE